MIVLRVEITDLRLCLISLIFESNDQAVGWDGTYKGEDAPLGVYTWTFVVDMGGGFIVKESGDVTLIR